MAFIETPGNLDDVPEVEAVPIGGPYDLCVMKVYPGKMSDNGRLVVGVSLTIEDSNYPNAKLVNHNLVFPNEDDKENDPRKYDNMMRGIKRFLYLFGCEWTESGFDSEDLEGSKASCNLGQSEYQGEISNDLRLPKIDV